MKVALIKPSLGEKGKKAYRTPAVMEPLAFALLAAFTPPDTQLSFFDERFEEIPFNESFDLVAISAETFTARRSYQIAMEFRKRGVKVILGGFHPTLLPEEASRFADSIAIGESEGIWKDVMDDLRNGTLRSKYYSGSQADFICKIPNREIFKGKKYLPVSMVETSRGCRYSCDFCSVRRFYADRVSHRSVSEVVAEVENSDRSFVFFVDDNLVASPKRAGELLTALKPLKIRWVSQASLETANDPAFLDLMVESGCFSLIVGLESLTPGNLRDMNKGWLLSLGKIEKLLAEYRKRGIMIYATFVFGYDGDTLSSFRDTVDFAIEQKLFMANFNTLYPFPGTEIYRKLSGEKRLLNEKWWLSPTQRWDYPAFRPRNFSPDELAHGVRSARARFNSISGVFQRALDWEANLSDPFHALIFLAGNAVSRRDISRKAGLLLGFSEPLPESIFAR